jgi:serine/threonine protein phosphatase PrpC
VHTITTIPTAIDSTNLPEELGLRQIITQYGFISEPSTEKTDATNEDASYLGKEDQGYLTYAVADGVGESPDARGWAQKLISLTPVVLSNRDAFASEFFKMQGAYLEDWERRKKIIIENNKNNWLFYHSNNPRIHRINGATYCSVTFHKTDEGLQYRALAIGDSCLFHISAGKVKKFFPLEKIEDFSRPPYVAYAGISEESLIDPTIGLRACSGNVEEGDFIILATDAIAQWIYAQHSNLDTTRFNELLTHAKANDVDAMRAYIGKERLNCTLKDDDTTLIILHVREGTT